MEKISWTDHVRNEEALLKVNEQRNILHEISKRKANWIGRKVHFVGLYSIEVVVLQTIQDIIHVKTSTCFGYT